MNKKTLVLGASDNPHRYSYVAIQRLRGAGHDVIGIGKHHGFASDVEIETKKINITDLDTVTLYLNPYHQREYYEYLFSLKPKRIIFNPGAENDELYQLALEHDILPLEACTLVLLSTGQYWGIINPLTIDHSLSTINIYLRLSPPVNKQFIEQLRKQRK